MSQPTCPVSTDRSAAISGRTTPTAEALSTPKNKATQTVSSTPFAACPAE